jgi:uncharacterized membrane protein
MVVYFSLVFISIIWLIIIFAIPVMVAHGFDNQFFIILYYASFKLICHQIPERSYFIEGQQLPVCVRCLGVYFGMLAGTLIYPVFKKIDSVKIPDIKYLYIILAPIIIDGAAQLFNLYNSPHYARFLTGLIGSAGLVFWAMPLLNRFFNALKKSK